MFSWNDNYSVGITEIDNQHKLLINLFNEIFEKRDNELDLNEKIIACEKFLNFAKWHFKCEFKYMTELKYSEIKEHLIEHSRIIKSLQDLKNGIDRFYDDNFLSELIIILKKWFISHLTMEDQKLYNHLKNNNFDKYIKFDENE